ncbi:MAG: hypothetical protein K6E70_08895 [Butyrivibrio sp.]|nr:hypothetical protein [Butyrivibrio sp.]
MTDREIGFEACINAIGRDFYYSHKEHSVFSCGEEEKGLLCYLGINTGEDSTSGLRLTNDAKWEYSASCYVNDGKVVMDFVKAPTFL